MAAFKLSKEQKIGLFSILTLVSLYIVVNYLKGKDLFSNRNTYYAIYHNVEGLTPTGPVYIRGLKVGTIETIEYNSINDNFTVTMKLKNQYTIPADSKAQSYSADLLGTKAIRIDMGDSGQFLGNKDTLATSSQGGMIEMLASEFIPLKDDISNLLSTLDSTLANVNSMMDQQAKDNISQALKNLNATLENTAKVTGSLSQNGPEITQIINNVKEITAKLDTGTISLNRGLENMAQISDSLKKADITGTLNSLKGLLDQLQNPDGSIGKLMHTGSLHNSADSLIREIEKLVDNINKNPKKYLKISVF